MRIDWGTFPDWLAGSGAILAVVFAAIAARAAWVANKVQSEQLRRLERADEIRQENEDREQAGRVAVWIRMLEAGVPGVICYNGSGLPVYRFLVVPVLAGLELDGAAISYSVKGPDPSPKLLAYATERACEAFIRAMPDVDGETVDWAQLYETGQISLAVRFTDSGGRSWFRDADGQLRRLTDGQ